MAWSPTSRLRAAGGLPAVTVLAAVAVGAAACTGSSSTHASSDAPAGSGGDAAALQSGYEHAVKGELPSVVQITAGSMLGSGVVYDSKGDIVTNAHVVGDQTTVRVRENTGTKEVTGHVLGKSMTDDLAVVRVPPGTGLKPARWANSRNVQIGEIVLAMGNPLGLSGSVTEGIVSGTGRTVRSSSEGNPGEGSASPGITDAIQTSAAINPGNSGGALVNLDDQVVGIPTAGALLPGENTAAQGIGFAIPSNTVKTVASQIISRGG